MTKKLELVYTHIDGKQFILRSVGSLPVQYRIGLLNNLSSYEIWISMERVEESIAKHPEFNIENILDIATESINKISAIHTNRMSDTVRFYTKIDKLHTRPIGISSDDMIFIALKLCGFHPYNFIKSIYIVNDYRKGGNPIWEEK